MLSAGSRLVEWVEQIGMWLQWLAVPFLNWTAVTQFMKWIARGWHCERNNFSFYFASFDMSHQANNVLFSHCDRGLNITGPLNLICESFSKAILSLQRKDQLSAPKAFYNYGHSSFCALMLCIFCIHILHWLLLLAIDFVNQKNKVKWSLEPHKLQYLCSKNTILCQESLFDSHKWVYIVSQLL